MSPIVAEALRLYRVVNNITLNEMSKKLGISACALSRLENGTRCGPENEHKLLKKLFYDTKPERSKP